MQHDRNAFDLLRVMLAVMVLYSHSYLIGGYGIEPLQKFSKGQINFGEIGVMGFFSLSGFLIAGSFDRSSNILIFLRNRFLRLFPGYWVCLLVTAFAFAPVIFYIDKKTLDTFNYWGLNGSFSFFHQNFFLSLRQWSIENVLQKSAYKDALNGSLWSLFPEMVCYILTLLCGFCGLFKNNKQVFLLMLVFVYTVYVASLYTQGFGPTILTLVAARKLYTAYLCGMAMYIFKDYINIDLKGLFFLALILGVLTKFGGILIVAPVGIAIFCIKGFALFKASFKYDISYGLYIYAFPIQQVLFSFFRGSISFAGYLILALLITGVFALISFLLVERPFLRMKRDKVSVTQH